MPPKDRSEVETVIGLGSLKAVYRHEPIRGRKSIWLVGGIVFAICSLGTTSANNIPLALATGLLVAVLLMAALIWRDRRYQTVTAALYDGGFAYRDQNGLSPFRWDQIKSLRHRLEQRYLIPGIVASEGSYVHRYVVQTNTEQDIRLANFSRIEDFWSALEADFRLARKRPLQPLRDATDQSAYRLQLSRPIIQRLDTIEFELTAGDDVVARYCIGPKSFKAETAQGDWVGAESRASLRGFQFLTGTPLGVRLAAATTDAVVLDRDRLLFPDGKLFRWKAAMRKDGKTRWLLETDGGECLMKFNPASRVLAILPSANLAPERDILMLMGGYMAILRSGFLPASD